MVVQPTHPGYIKNSPSRRPPTADESCRDRMAKRRAERRNNQLNEDFGNTPDKKKEENE